MPRLPRAVNHSLDPILPSPAPRSFQSLPGPGLQRGPAPQLSITSWPSDVEVPPPRVGDHSLAPSQRGARGDSRGLSIAPARDVTEEVSRWQPHWLRGWVAAASRPPLTLGRLRLHEGLDEQVSGLRVEGQGVAQGLQVRALFQKGLLEAHATCMEVLLWRTGRGEVSLVRQPHTPTPPPLPCPVVTCWMTRGLRTLVGSATPPPPALPPKPAAYSTLKITPSLSPLASPPAPRGTCLRVFALPALLDGTASLPKSNT